MNTLRTLALAAALLLAFQLPPKPLTAQSSPAAQTLREAEAAFRSGRPDYVLARRALEQAGATDDLSLQARAYRLQARLDSAGRRYSRAMPNFRRAEELEARIAATESASVIEAARAEAASAEQQRLAAEEARVAAETELAEAESAARMRYLTVIGICLAILAAGVLAYLATVRSLTAKVRAAEAARRESDAAYAEARTALGESARTGMRQLRRVYQALAARMPVTPGDRAAAHLAAQGAALDALAQSSFEQGGRHEVAMEAFFEKLRPGLERLLRVNDGQQVAVASMPLRLGIDEAVPLALAYVELVGNALRHGSGAVATTLSKEGPSVTLAVSDEGDGNWAAQPAGEGRKLVAFFADAVGAQVDYPSGGGGSTVRLRYEAQTTRGAAAGIG